jgi:hypothetical protein
MPLQSLHVDSVRTTAQRFTPLFGSTLDNADFESNQGICQRGMFKRRNLRVDLGSNRCLSTAPYISHRSFGMTAESKFNLSADSSLPGFWHSIASAAAGNTMRRSRPGIPISADLNPVLCRTFASDGKALKRRRTWPECEGGHSVPYEDWMRRPGLNRRITALQTSQGHPRRFTAGQEWMTPVIIS